MAPTGSGSACTQGSPCDLATAVSLAGEGSFIYVAAGTYTGTGTEVVKLENSVNLLGGWDGAASGAVLRNPQVHVSVLDGQDARRVIFVDRNRPLIDGFTITRGNSTKNGGGIYVNDGLPTIRHNILSANYGTSYGSAMYVAKGGANVEVNQILANEVQYGGTLSFSGDTQGEVHGNLFADNLASYGSAVHADNASLSCTHNIMHHNIGSVLDLNRSIGVLDISNNLFHHNQGGSVRLQNQAQGNIYHNTFATANPIALELNYTSSATFSNNIVTHCVFESIYKDGTSTISGTNNLFFGTTAIPTCSPTRSTLDPQYIDEALDNYQLQRGSPALNAGVDLGVLDDLLLVRRPIGLAPDLGAYEQKLYVFLPLVMKP